MRERFRAGKLLWEPVDDELLRLYYPDNPTEDLADCLGRSLSTTYQRARHLGLIKSAARIAAVTRDAQRNLQPGGRRWTAAEDALLRARYQNEPTAAIARELGRTLTAVYARAVGHLGLEKSAAFVASAASGRLQRADHRGRAYWYPKGHTPANKGLRRPGYGPGRMKETQFKPGESRNTMPIGSTRLCDGYVLVKVAAVPKVPYFVNWLPLHVIEWERVNGPVPPGHCLAFRNGNKRDVRLENLECITRRELMARNTVHNLPPALAKTVQLLGALNRQINRRGGKTDGEEQNRGPARPPVRRARRAA